MKLKFTVIALLTFYLSIGQNWLDDKCSGIIEEVNLVEFESSKSRNILDIVIDQSEEIVINGEVSSSLNSEIRFKEYILDFVSNPNKAKDKAENPYKAYIRINSYNKNLEKLNRLESYIKDVYVFLWDTAAEEKYESTYLALNCKKREKIYKSFPYQVINPLGAPKKSTNTRKRMGVGVPPFGGDVKKQ